MRLAPGQKVGERYTLIRRVGSGGMADVWSAEDSMLGREVALKFLHERFGADEGFVERFRREAQSAAGLQHPNVVGVYDRGEHEGHYWISMEYVQGASLKDLIERGLSQAEAVEIVRQILAGARFAHERGIVHRDLKPHNVLVDAEGRARVTDFGIARAGASEITQTGSVLGTAQYLSPEQAQGMETTASSDIYSVGVILYEALTGRLPFEAETAVAIAMKQVSEAPRPPRELNPEVSPAMNAVVLKALAKDPADRYPDAESFIRALDEAEANPEAGGTAVYAAVPVDPDAEEDSGRKKLIALAVLALLLLGVGAWALTRSEQVRVPTVIGESQQDARDKLAEAGFEVVSSNFESCDEPQTVSEQDPPAGSQAEKGSTVEIAVSLGMQVAVPSKGVVGAPAQDATKRLRAQNLQVDSREVFSNTNPGNVARVEPPAGAKVECESVVTILVSKGPNLVTVPSLIGLEEADAEAQIRDLGLTPNVDTENSDAPEGEVIGQDPGPDSQLKKGTEVVITVSNGSGTVVVPSVEGQKRDSAIATLSSRGAQNVKVVEQETDDKSLDDRVTDQAPSAGTRIRAGDQVTLFVAVFVEPEEPAPPEEPGGGASPRERAIRP